jgi:hypothetical protein
LFKATDYDTDRYLTVAKLGRDWQCNQTVHRFHRKKFNLKKGNEVENEEQ